MKYRNLLYVCLIVMLSSAIVIAGSLIAYGAQGWSFRVDDLNGVFLVLFFVSLLASIVFSLLKEKKE